TTVRRALMITRCISPHGVVGGTPLSPYGVLPLLNSPSSLFAMLHYSNHSLSPVISALLSAPKSPDLEPSNGLYRLSYIPRPYSHRLTRYFGLSDPLRSCFAAYAAGSLPVIGTAVPRV